MVDERGYPVLVPTKDTTAQTFIDAFKAQALPVFGVPDEMVSDRASNFNAQLVQEVYKDLGLEKITTTSFHPQPNVAETMVKAAKGVIAKLVQEYKADWDTLVPQVLMRLRSWNKLPFKMSPHRARTGVDMQLPSAFENPMHVSEAATTARWKEIDAIIVNARDEAAIKYKGQYDKTHEHKEFKVGQRV